MSSAKSNHINCCYKALLQLIMAQGTTLSTRNHETISHIRLPNISIDTFPLVTIRPVAALKAIAEWDWFQSGNIQCPEPLLDWWDGQLDGEGRLVDGYSSQFRRFSYRDIARGHGDEEDGLAYFDQIGFLIDEIKEHKHSRRLIMQSWNSGEMANITSTNQNPDTPTCCHSIIVQFFVRDDTLHMSSYQRSADMLLGVPHNWVQSWAFLVWMAHHTGFKLGTMQWMFGDAHIYKESSHLAVVNALLDTPFEPKHLVNSMLNYTYSGGLDEFNYPAFSYRDFVINKPVVKPLTTIRPALL